MRRHTEHHTHGRETTHSPFSYCNNVISKQHRLAPETSKAEPPRGAGAGAGNLIFFFGDRVGGSVAEASFFVCAFGHLASGIWLVVVGVGARNHHFGRFRRGSRGTRSAFFCYRGTQAASSQRWCDLVVRETAQIGAGQGRQCALTLVIRVYVYSSLYSIWKTGGYFNVSAHENKDPRAVLGILSKTAAVTVRQHQGKMSGM